MQSSKKTQTTPSAFLARWADETQLWYAAWDGDFEKMKKILEQPDVDVNQRSGWDGKNKNI